MGSVTSPFARIGDKHKLALAVDGYSTGDTDDVMDVLPSYDPPTGVPLIDAASVARNVSLRPRTWVTGCAGCLTALLLRRMAIGVDKHQLSGPIVCVTATSERAHQLAEDLRFFCGESHQVLLLDAVSSSPYADVNPDRRIAQSRLATLSHIAQGRGFRFLVASGSSLLRKVIPPEIVVSHTAHIAPQQEIDRDAVVAGLSDSGYLHAPLVEDPGSYAVRGAIIDVWPSGSPCPFRIELYGDLVLSIKRFDPESQRTLVDVAWVSLPPARDAIRTALTIQRARKKLRELCDAVSLPSLQTVTYVEDVCSGRSFLGSDGVLPAFADLVPISRYLVGPYTVVIEDPPSVNQAISEELDCAVVDEAAMHGKPHFPVEAFWCTSEDVLHFLTSQHLLTLHRQAIYGEASADTLESLEYVPSDTPTMAAHDMLELETAINTAKVRVGKASTMTPLVRRIGHWQSLGFRVLIAARADTQAERMTTLLRHRDVSCVFGAFEPEMLDTPRRSVLVVTGSLSGGVVAPSEGWVFVTEEEIFGHRSRRRERRASSSSLKQPSIDDLRVLAVGDFVVHTDHGVGKYLGLINKQIGNAGVDLIVVEYAGGDKLYLPVYRLNQIQKHSAAEGTQKLDRLGGQTFARTKLRVRANVRKLADELLRLYAQRQALSVAPLDDPDDDYRAFEATFPFEETPDQSSAIEDVMRDQSSLRPMDRLVCGDVGFGKTEVAIRAAFRTANQSRQVAVLCPTTVLAQQHLLSFRSRLESYGIDVRGLSRFQTKTEQSEVLRGLRSGRVDVVIGTHRILSKDVHFKSLGLLVVDEEQRFGVVHKERIKQIKQSVDVLSLSATPIPRTLQMAVSGLRDISLIRTPPVDRRAIRTIVTREEPRVLTEAILRELSRGGQVFYVYNRIEGLYEKAAKLQSLVPAARIAVAHGQMPEASLERSMLDFVEGRYDILACTAIIESGIDIPRANTIIIDRADMFGLSQLYQLRGRVGRSRERAYCYLIVPPVGAMSDDARSRVEAIEQNTELGSGFKIASLDLELRGSGDLLGADQSGNVASVGFDIFRTMLQDAVCELRGDPVIHDIEPELSFDVEALLADDYVADVGVRLSFYKRLASAIDERDVDELAIEMEDRFGPPPAAARSLIHLMRLKTALRRLRILGCEATTKSVVLHLADDHKLDARKLAKLAQERPKLFQASVDMRLTRRASEKDKWRNGLDALESLMSEIDA